MLPCLYPQHDYQSFMTTDLHVSKMNQACEPKICLCLQLDYIPCIGPEQLCHWNL